MKECHIIYVDYITEQRKMLRISTLNAKIYVVDDNPKSKTKAHRGNPGSHQNDRTSQNITWKSTKNLINVTHVNPRGPKKMALHFIISNIFEFIK